MKANNDVVNWYSGRTEEEHPIVAIIAPVPLEEALRSHTPKELSARTLRTRELEQDAESVVEAINDKGAAVIDVDEREDSAAHYLAGLRSALARRGHSGILLRKKRGQPQIVAWKARPEDRARMETKRKTGARLGQIAKARAAAARAPQGRPDSRTRSVTRA